MSSQPNQRADIEVSHDGDTVKLKAPDGGTALTAPEAQELAGRIFEAAARAGGDDPVENDWVRIPMQYLQVTAERLDFSGEGDENTVPAPNSDDPDGSTATVHCWIKDQTQNNALHITSGNIAEHGWFISEVIEHAPVKREDVESDYVEYYDKAVAESEVFLYEINEDNPEGADDA
ncbi:hypothetical protein GobsT_69290 [Gemmata obscuriglobus]|uniref:Uncharacterized protein n=1 Tax=Gemmata obscuriglobus TaxID=114 RepID=A0A2Z3HC11_9BACT|nr:hypothetical protein [Gemmata obscuriglobus]AWM41942.1 hypothetical protein C1280_36420 [Gemmata obscuriglobus]QEG32078.1 hypothetical protein GobsT_69290 [Gemmata obscuriglobus]VTS11431.1 unnamed protein product [Gemmata obscuriglobus UQM 2246]